MTCLRIAVDATTLTPSRSPINATPRSKAVEVAKARTGADHEFRAIPTPRRVDDAEQREVGRRLDAKMHAA